MKPSRVLSVLTTQLLVSSVIPTCAGFSSLQQLSLTCLDGGGKTPHATRYNNRGQFKFLTASSPSSPSMLSASDASDQDENGAAVKLASQMQASSSSSLSSSTTPSEGDGDNLETAANKRSAMLTRAVSTLLLVAATTVLYSQRQPILAFLTYVRKEWLYTTLGRLEAAGTVGLIIYGVAFFVWELTLGITTPIETAAGIAFGSTKAIIASGTAKFLGAIVSFLVSRHLLRSKVEPFVKRQELLGLIEESIEEMPFRVALLMRFSPLPEVVKNCGAAVLPVSFRYFTATLLLHGFSFTCLWSCLGGETAQLMRNGGSPSKSLKMLMTAASWIGIGAQLGIGYWIKTLRDKQVKRHSHDEDNAAAAAAAPNSK